MLVSAPLSRADAQYLETGKSLLERCKSGTGGAVYCLGYIAGIADAMAAGNVVNNAKACLPGSAREGLLQDVVVTFLERQKDLEGFAAVGLVAAALKEGFPCPK
jgi:hypothetical protein